MSNKWIGASNLSVADRIFYRGKQIQPTDTLNTIKPFPILTASFKGVKAVCDNETRYDVGIDKLNNVDYDYITIDEDDEKSFKFSKEGYYFIVGYCLESLNEDIHNRYVIGLTKKNDEEYVLCMNEINFHYPFLEFSSNPFYISDTSLDYQFTYLANNTLKKDYSFNETFKIFIFAYNNR